MFTGYLDETGDGKDPHQRIVGMAGLLAPANHWEKFESKWKRALADFKIPYFHMKEFAHSTGVFEEWKGREILRRKLFGKLIKIMEGTYPIPIGAVVAKETYDTVHSEFPEFKKEEPYYSTLKYCVSGLAGVRLCMDFLHESENTALVLSHHAQFKNRVLRHYDQVTKELPGFDKISPISFADMRQLVPLQAADIVAYELKKEHERRLYQPQKPPRYGFERLMKMTSRHTAIKIPMFYFLDRDLLTYSLRLASGIKVLAESGS